MAGFRPNQYLYIPLTEDSKRPVASWGGWPIDPVHKGVFTYQETEEDDWSEWGIVGNWSGTLLVIDVDAYKMEDTQRNRILNDEYGGLLDVTSVVKSQNGGYHLYFQYDGRLSDFEVENHVDIKGDVGGGYVKSPFCEGYELVNDKSAVSVDADALSEFPVFQDAETYESETHAGAMNLAPPCIKRAINEGDKKSIAFKHEYTRQKFGASAVRTDDVYNVLDESEYPVNERVEAPAWMHDNPSSTQANFMVDEDTETFRCWRHDVTGNTLHLLGLKYGIITCENLQNGNISTSQWVDIGKRANDDGIDFETDSELTCENVKKEGLCPVDCPRKSPLK